MKKTAAVLLAALMVTSSVSFAATLSSQSKDQVQQTFVNKTFTSLPMPFLGQPINNIFTGYMDDQNKIWGKFAQLPQNNVPQVDQGVYTMKDDGQLCITWQHWMNAKEICVYTYETNNAYLIVSNDNNFHVAFMKSAVQPGRQI